MFGLDSVLTFLINNSTSHNKIISLELKSFKTIIYSFIIWESWFGFKLTDNMIWKVVRSKACSQNKTVLASKFLMSENFAFLKYWSFVFPCNRQFVYTGNVIMCLGENDLLVKSCIQDICKVKVVFNLFLFFFVFHFYIWWYHWPKHPKAWPFIFDTGLCSFHAFVASTLHYCSTGTEELYLWQPMPDR